MHSGQETTCVFHAILISLHSTFIKRCMAKAVKFKSYLQNSKIRPRFQYESGMCPHQQTSEGQDSIAMHPSEFFCTSLMCPLAPYVTRSAPLCILIAPHVPT